MKLGIVAQRPIFTTPYKSINVHKSLWHKDFLDSDKMYLHISPCICLPKRCTKGV